MTGLDRDQNHPGYWPASSWPVECGGNRRQKAAPGRLDANSHTARVITRRDDKWHVMAIERDPGQWYVGGTMPAFSGPAPHGWIERIDIDTLEPVASSPNLPCGEHVWCGAILAHANGSIMSVNGSYLHRLHPDDLHIEAERALPADRSHNGLLALADGTLITKDLRLEGQSGSTITRLRPDTLEVIDAPIVLPEPSMGRIASDLQVYGDSEATETIIIPGSEHIFALRVVDDRLIIDDSWGPTYRAAQDDFGLAWDSCLSDGAVWIMDCGDIESVRAIHNTEPNGRWDAPPGKALSWRRTAPWAGPQRLHRIDATTGEAAEIAPFGTPGGGIIAPPVHVPEHDMAIAWDSINGGLAGVNSEGSLSVAWQRGDLRPTMQPVVFPESGELVINTFTDEGHDDLVVIDVETGQTIDQVSTGSTIANGMFLSPGPGRSVIYCSTLTLARVVWGTQ